MSQVFMLNKIVIGGALAVLLSAGGYYLWTNYEGNLGEPLGKRYLVCDGEKTIEAVFYESNVKLTLSDGRKITLPQVVAGYGVEYANKDKTLVFWSQADSGFISEGKNQEKTFNNCLSALPGEEPKVNYTSSTTGISLKYPKSFILDEGYVYEFSKEKSIKGIKFTIPPSMATGTNLSLDTGFSVESLPRAKKCTGEIYLKEDVKSEDVAENGVNYSLAKSSGAAAGNMYEEIVYAFPESSPCVAVRYFIHSTNIGNYEPGAVVSFDKEKLISEFDKIRQSIKIGD